ncbi:indolepyruvate ferredoxin oxidoreductase subunit alpha [Aminipila luticellarii]|uniref:Indolepyruvate oxidoreductase subunit IorA n=1 Tax=Aminipila luticellarii TaxID=2507160 RepID=A0A410PTC8_9FIRM|nr:indolepyruvate ferredoxin oxidoreductase subunit alpha [Aminipila luticellarii]QAT42222.1 indolepyruvate ferredoxin oxidoreductase subunit alpha [Aminipila luticellarii]
MRKIMTGNEAVARGAYEAGLEFASAYPGTPSTEILENIVHYKDVIYCEWAPNEKVALEAAIGASVAGARSMAAMKHVGVNVAADPLFTFAYTGVTGGCVLVSADDPGMHSSQNEQDNRNYATAARVLMLEPSDSQESKDFMKLGLELSEKFDTPVLLRMTTRVCHSKSLVTLEDREPRKIIPYEHNIAKYVATPANGKVLRRKLIDRLKNMEAYSNTTEINRAEYNDTEIGVISSGVAYQYAREVFGDKASYLKLGMTFPMPMAKIKEFASKVKKIYVIEEMDPYIENHLKMAGIPCIGKEVIPEMDELNTDIVRQAVFGTEMKTLDSEMEAVVRPPTLCAGCPHRGIFYTLSKKKNLMVTGDIGCYTLGSAPPLSAMHTCFCMGGSVSTGHGASTVLKRAGSDLKVAAVIGDSTFFHSGITSLIDVVYNKGNSVTIILDNRITAMTGHQQNPGTGYTLMGEPATEVDIPMLCKAIGVKDENLFIINPLELDKSGEIVDKALATDEPTVIITKWPCILKKFTDQDKAEFDLSPKKCEIDQEKCTKCRMCVRTGCPAINSGEMVEIDPQSCTGCGVCRQVCKFGAIKEVKR